MQPSDEREGIDVQGRAQAELRAVVCWGRDWRLGFTSKCNRQFGLISLPRERASTGVSLPN